VLKVYLETSFFSECCTIRTGEIARGRRAVSREWWEKQAVNFRLFVSSEVIRELSSAAFPAEVREPCLDMALQLESLIITPSALEVAQALVDSQVMPRPATGGDAVHAAAAITNRLDYLLTWNQRHLANLNKRTQLAVVCSRLGFVVPEIVTPDIMRMEEGHDQNEA